MIQVYEIKMVENPQAAAAHKYISIEIHKSPGQMSLFRSASLLCPFIKWPIFVPRQLLFAEMLFKAARVPSLLSFHLPPLLQPTCLTSLVSHPLHLLSLNAADRAGGERGDRAAGGRAEGDSASEIQRGSKSSRYRRSEEIRSSVFCMYVCKLINLYSPMGFFSPNLHLLTNAISRIKANKRKLSSSQQNIKQEADGSAAFKWWTNS